MMAFPLLTMLRLNSVLATQSSSRKLHHFAKKNLISSQTTRILILAIIAFCKNNNVRKKISDFSTNSLDNSFSII